MEIRNLVVNLSLCLAIGSAVVTPAAHADVAEDANAIIGQLSPVNLALGGLIDRAVAKGDKALETRLRQLQGIVQDALTTADGIAQRRIHDLDRGAQNRLADLRRTINDALPQLNALTQGTVEATSLAASKSIEQVQQQLGGLVEAINWLGVEPVVNITPEGLRIYKQTGDQTLFTVSGVGLRKANRAPQGWVSVGDKQVPLTVKSSMPNGVELMLPNKDLQQIGVRSYNVRLQFSRGYYVDSLSWLPDAINLKKPLEVSFPVVVGVLGPYSADGMLTASGEFWERMTINNSNYGASPGINCNKGDKPNPITVVAIAQGGYDVDTGAGISNGLSWGECTGEGGERNCTKVAQGLVIWCSAEHADRGGHQETPWVKSHLRRVAKTSKCGESSGTAQLRYGQTTQIVLDKTRALGACVEPGLSATPELTAKVIVHRPYGAPDFVKTIRPNVLEKLDDDPITLLLSEDGVLSIALKPTFHWFYPPAPAPRQ